MTTAEERLKILNMIAEGKISAEEGAKLLNALRQPKGKQRSPIMTNEEGNQARFLRVRVTDLESGKVKVNVTLPIGLIEVGMRMGARFVPEIAEVDFEEIAEGIRSGLHGKIVDVEDHDDSEHVEVYLE